MVDLDEFKQINDLHGHLAGDAVLREAAQRIRQGLRAYDSVGRYGGEEFLMILPNCDLQNALSTAERIRARLAEHPIDAGPLTVFATASFGLARLQPNQSPHALLACADAALLQAKRGGRNRIVGG
jgi:diguanylate cyclase (GGDEF)-like protein